jgi:hypothetical protein
MIEPAILTVGHSNHPIEHFLRLVKNADVGMVVDVRWQNRSTVKESPISISEKNWEAVRMNVLLLLKIPKKVLTV